MCFPLGLQIFLCWLGQLIPLTIIVIIIQSLDLMAGFFNKGTETIFLPETRATWTVSMFIRSLIFSTRLWATLALLVISSSLYLIFACLPSQRISSQ